jgi:bacteriocin-like protein
MEKSEKGGVRILGRQVGEVLSNEELSQVSGGGPLSGNAEFGGGTDNPPHGGTCTNETDCD